MGPIAGLDVSENRKDVSPEHKVLQPMIKRRETGTAAADTSILEYYAEGRALRNVGNC
jgi:hypothetical protein